LRLHTTRSVNLPGFQLMADKWIAAQCLHYWLPLWPDRAGVGWEVEEELSGAAVVFEPALLRSRTHPGGPAAVAKPRDEAAMRSIQGLSPPQAFSDCRTLLELPCGAAVIEPNSGSRNEAVAFLPSHPLLPPNLERCPWRRLRKKRVRQFRVGDGQFLLPQQHGHLGT